MEFTAQKNDQYTLLKISGRVDISNAHKLSQDLKGQKCASLLVVDVSEIDIISSSGMGALMSLMDQQERCGGKLVILSPSMIFNKVLDILELRPYFLIFETLPEALEIGRRKSKIPA